MLFFYVSREKQWEGDYQAEKSQRFKQQLLVKTVGDNYSIEENDEFNLNGNILLNIEQCPLEIE